MNAQMTPTMHGRAVLNTIIVLSVDQLLPGTRPAVELQPVTGEKALKHPSPGLPRLTCGRNDPCPCGCGRKAKRCSKRVGA